MQIIGFNLTKISASKNEELKNTTIGTNMEFIDLEKTKLEFLKDKETFKVNFQFSVDYQDQESRAKSKGKDKETQAEINFEGNVAILVADEEAKELTKSWKKKELPSALRVFLFNFIIKKCSSHALMLQDQLNLPTHIQIPQIVPKQQIQEVK